MIQPVHFGQVSLQVADALRVIMLAGHRVLVRCLGRLDTGDPRTPAVVPEEH